MANKSNNVQLIFCERSVRIYLNSAETSHISKCGWVGYKQRSSLVKSQQNLYRFVSQCMCDFCDNSTCHRKRPRSYWICALPCFILCGMVVNKLFCKLVVTLPTLCCSAPLWVFSYEKAVRFNFKIWNPSSPPPPPPISHTLRHYVLWLIIESSDCTMQTHTQCMGQSVRKRKMFTRKHTRKSKSICVTWWNMRATDLYG